MKGYEPVKSKKNDHSLSLKWVDLVMVLVHFVGQARPV